jgi:hypothetical protein
VTVTDTAADAVLAQLIAAVAMRPDALDLLERAAETLTARVVPRRGGPGQPEKPDGPAIEELGRLLADGVAHGQAVHRAARFCIDGCCVKSKHRIARKWRTRKVGQNH